jgi:hypothetical protein
MKKLLIDWDGEHLPAELKTAPPGRYLLQAVSLDTELSGNEDQGITDALRQLDAGEGRSLADVIQEIRAGTSRR